jgi:hypothetical protein
MQMRSFDKFAKAYLSILSEDVDSSTEDSAKSVDGLVSRVASAKPYLKDVFPEMIILLALHGLSGYENELADVLIRLREVKEGH